MDSLDINWGKLPKKIKPEIRMRLESSFLKFVNIIISYC